MKPTLEEYVESLKAELKREIAKREDSEYRHAVTAEALENLLDVMDESPVIIFAFLTERRAGRKALNGIAEE